MTKTKQDNNVINHIDAVYIEKGNELLWSIKSSANCDENQIG